MCTGQAGIIGERRGPGGKVGSGAHSRAGEALWDQPALLPGADAAVVLPDLPCFEIIFIWNYLNYKHWVQYF